MTVYVLLEDTFNAKYGEDYAPVGVTESRLDAESWQQEWRGPRAPSRMIMEFTLGRMPKEDEENV